VTSTIYFAGGCFWCIEAIFQRIKGVDKVVSGYTGGDIKNPAYREVCKGTTGHAEVVAISFIEEVVRLVDLLLIFFKAHDPTTLNKQGNDVGTQYRSAIFYTSEEQKKIINTVIQQIEKEKVFSTPLVTQVAPFTVFYPAEDEHNNYYNTHKEEPYCATTISPKIETLKLYFKNYLQHTNHE